MQTTPQRFLPLDVFRGLTVCFMIIVNTPGTNDIFAPLEHARWHGFTPTDLVFPSFLFAVGNAMSFSMRKYQQMGNATVLSKIFRRTLLIFLLGFIMYWLPFVRTGADGHWEFIPVSDTRILGVLQRIALCYCFASLLIHYLPKKALWIVSAVLLLGYWAIMYAFGEPGAPYEMHSNAALFVDKFIMGDSHLYHGEGFAFDPEGILSTLPAIVNVIAGYLAGLFIQEKGKTTQGITRLISAGAILILIAWLWNTQFPVNKKLWTSSFVLNTVGIDLLIISLLIYIIDFKSSTGWTSFFTVFGKNPLFLYLLSEVGVIFLSFFTIGTVSVFAWLNIHIFQPIAPGKVGSLIFALTYMLFCWSVGKILDKKRIYVRV
jgi:predicted acyltransferase